MVEIILAESAWDDLDSITDTDFIAKDSLRFAIEFSKRVFEQLEQLKTFPKSGRKVPEYNNEDLRELILGGYRIVYRIFNVQEIYVLRIIHGSKSLI